MYLYYVSISENAKIRGILYDMVSFLSQIPREDEIALKSQNSCFWGIQWEFFPSMQSKCGMSPNIENK